MGQDLTRKGTVGHMDSYVFEGTLVQHAGIKEEHKDKFNGRNIMGSSENY